MARLASVFALRAPATLRPHLLKLILVALGPLIIFSAVLIILFGREEHATLTMPSRVAVI